MALYLALPAFLQNIVDWFMSLGPRFYQNFIEEDRWKYITNGLKVTLIITFFSVIIGILLGFIVGVIRTTYDQLMLEVKSKFLRGLLRIINFIAKAYVTVIRGTPSMTQLLIMYYVIFRSPNVSKMVVAIVAFGMNSGAYVSEIVRGGIQSIDRGQMEAGRSLGFGYVRTMMYFIIPQAFKAILPSLGNEMIVLMKETAIVGYISLEDLNRGGDYIRSRTYEAFMPLIAVALIYLALVSILSWLLSCVERRLAKSDRG